MVLRAALVLAAALLLAACSADPVPLERSAYVGEWHAPDMLLVIRPDGFVHYERRKGSSRTTVNAPLQRFEGDNFVVGFGPFSTTFVVSRPPHDDNGAWKMTVDGVSLVRRGGAGGGGIRT